MDWDQPGVCLCGIHSRIPILSFLEDPRLGFRLVLLFGRAAPGQAPSALGNPWDPSLEPKFPSLMPSSSFLGEPQLQGCSLPHVLGCLPRAGSYSSLEHWLQKLLFLILMKQTNGKNLYIVLVFYLFCFSFFRDRAEAFYRAILVPNPCRHRVSLVCRLKCQPRAISDHSWTLLSFTAHPFLGLHWQTWAMNLPVLSYGSPALLFFFCLFSIPKLPCSFSWMAKQCLTLSIQFSKGDLFFLREGDALFPVLCQLSLILWTVFQCLIYCRVRTVPAYPSSDGSRDCLCELELYLWH